jgi:hypothetical protein
MLAVLVSMNIKSSAYARDLLYRGMPREGCVQAMLELWRGSLSSKLRERTSPGISLAGLEGGHQGPLYLASNVLPKFHLHSQLARTSGICPWGRRPPSYYMHANPQMGLPSGVPRRDYRF